MFSLRGLQGRMVLVLVLGVLILGFMLEGDYVQVALASDSDCDRAWQDYSRASLSAKVICLNYGSDSDECASASLRALYYFMRAVVICLN